MTATSTTGTTETVAIILVAGHGTRLMPITSGLSKGLVPVYDKKSIDYSVANVIAAGIKRILIIAAPGNVDEYEAYLGNGSRFGIQIEYAVQEKQIGIGDAFIIGEKFIGQNNVALVLGDNIFSGRSFTKKLRGSIGKPGARVFAMHVTDPRAFGVVEFDRERRVISLEEKPTYPKSNYAVPGMYFYDSRVVEFAKKLEPSARGELEITDINKMYLAEGNLHVTVLDSDTTYFDVGNARALLSAANFVQGFQDRQGQLLGSPEAEAFLVGNITAWKLTGIAQSLIKTEYGQLLEKLAKNGTWL